MLFIISKSIYLDFLEKVYLCKNTYLKSIKDKEIFKKEFSWKVVKFFFD